MVTRLQRDMDSQSQSHSLQEHAAMTLFRTELFEAETAVTRAGATAGRSEADVEARTSELQVEYREGVETILIIHQLFFWRLRERSMSKFVRGRTLSKP